MLPAPGRTKKNALQMKVTYGPVKKGTTCTQENFPKKHVWFAVRRATEPVSCPPAVTVSKGILFGAVEGILAGCAEKDLHGAGKGTRAWGAARCRWSACSICKLPLRPRTLSSGLGAQRRLGEEKQVAAAVERYGEVRAQISRHGPCRRPNLGRQPRWRLSNPLDRGRRAGYPARGRLAKRGREGSAAEPAAVDAAPRRTVAVAAARA